MAKDHLSALRDAYAAARGCDKRTAQRHSKAGHPDWLRFIGQEAAAGVKEKRKGGEANAGQQAALAAVSPFRPVELPAFYDVPDEDLHPVQLSEKRAWQAHQTTFGAWERMQGDPMVSLAYVRELPKLRDDFVKARVDRERWELEQRRLVTMSEFERFSSEFILPLAEMLKNLPSELASMVNPDNPAFARSQIADWLRTKAQPQIGAMLRGREEFLAA